jgi:hypothetical protein
MGSSQYKFWINVAIATLIDWLPKAVSAWQYAQESPIAASNWLLTTIFRAALKSRGLRAEKAGRSSGARSPAMLRAGLSCFAAQ